MNYNQRYAILGSYKKAILQIYPNTPNTSGIYILKRKNGDKIAVYVGQSINVLERLASHLMTKNKSLHIDASLYKYGLKNLTNPKGWELKCFEKSKSELDTVEQQYIDQYLKQENYDVYNVTSGGQCKGKEKIAEFKPRKGWNAGKIYGKKQLAKDLKHISDNYLEIKTTKDNKISKRMLGKYNNLIDI